MLGTKHIATTDHAAGRDAMLVVRGRAANAGDELSATLRHLQARHAHVPRADESVFVRVVPWDLHQALDALAAVKAPPAAGHFAADHRIGRAFGFAHKAGLDTAGAR